MNDDKILAELKNISNYLELLSAELKKLSNYLAMLSIEPTKKLLDILENKEILTSKQRIDMFLRIDGVRTTPEIAEKVDIGQEGARVFMKELEGKGFIRLERKGKTFVPIKNYEKIFEFVLSDEKSEK